MSERASDEFVVRCCVCGRERVGDDWVRPARPARPAPLELIISHSYCPECFQVVRARLRALVSTSR